MARKPKSAAPVAETNPVGLVLKDEPERVPLHEAPAIEVQMARRDDPASLALRAAAIALRDAFGRVTSGDRLALARRGLNETVEIALGKD